MKRTAATLAAVALGLTLAACRALLAPIRWAERLTADPPPPVKPLRWLPHEDDMDAWPTDARFGRSTPSDDGTGNFRWLPVGVDPDDETSQNGKQKARRG